MRPKPGDFTYPPPKGRGMLIVNLSWLKMHIQLTNNNKKEIQILFVQKLREAFKFQKRLILGKIEQLYPTLLLLTFESSRTVQCFIFWKLCVCICTWMYSVSDSIKLSSHSPSLYFFLKNDSSDSIQCLV